MNSTSSCSFSNPYYFNGTNIVPVDNSLHEGQSFAYASETCQTDFSPVTSSTGNSYYGGFSYGQIVLSTLLFIVVVCLAELLYFLHFRRIKIRNQ